MANDRTYTPPICRGSSHVMMFEGGVLYGEPSERLRRWMERDLYKVSRLTLVAGQ